MKILITVILILNSTVCFAKSDDEIMVDKALESAARAYVMDSGRQYLNQSVHTLPGIQGNVPRVGDKAMLVAGLAFAVDDFLKAKSDKERTYATAEAACAVVTYVFAPAGLIASVAVFAARLVDGALDAAAAVDIMALEKQAEEFIAKANNLRTMDVNADIKFVDSATENINATNKKISELRDNIKSSCKDPAKLIDFNLLDKCLGYFTEIVSQKQILVGYSDALLNFKSLYFDADGAFSIIKDGNRAEFQKTADEYRKELNEEKENLNGMIIKTAKLTTEVIKKKAEINGSFTVLEQTEISCTDGALDLANASESALYARAIAHDGAQAAIDYVTLPVLYESMREFADGSCESLQSKRSGVTEALATFKSQYARMKKEMGQ